MFHALGKVRYGLAVDPAGQARSSVHGCTSGSLRFGWCFEGSLEDLASNFLGRGGEASFAA